MATIGNQSLTLADWATRMDPDGTTAQVIDLLSQSNQMMDEMVWLPTNKVDSYLTTVRTGLPEGTWRRLYQGVQPTKSTTAQIEEATGNLEAYSRTDKKLADMNGNTAEFRMQEDASFIEGLTQQMQEALIYSNTVSTPDQIMGFAPRYNSLTGAATGENIIDMGGAGSTNTSIWLVGWGPLSVFGAFPKGVPGGLQQRDLGEQTWTKSDGSMLQVYTTHFQWQAGLVIRDWRYVVRIANIDVTTLDDATPPDLVTALLMAMHMVPTAPTSARIPSDPSKPAGVMGFTRFAIYVNRTVAAALDKQAKETTNVLLSMTEWDGHPVTLFRGIPIRIVDKILDTEDAVA